MLSKTERRLYMKKWFGDHPGYHASKKRGYRRRNREYLIRYANHRGCDECGENTEFLFFHNGEVANRNVRERGKATVSIETLNKEVTNRGLLCEACLKGLYPSGRELGF